MERMTYKCQECWQLSGADNLVCEEICSKRYESGEGCVNCPIAKAIDLLAEFEDLGFTPKEIKYMLSCGEKIVGRPLSEFLDIAKMS